MNQQRHVLIGAGNPDRGDDAAGRFVARALASKLPAEVAIVELSGEMTEVLDQLQGAAAAVLVDASSSGAAAGAIQRFDAVAEPLPRTFFGVSTHGVGIADAIELARVLNGLPAVCIVYAIEAQCFDTGAAPCAPVLAAVQEVAARVCREFEQLLVARDHCDA